MIPSLAARFERCVERTPGCWLWIGCLDGTGRGTIKDAGKQVGAHRASWKLHFGEIPEGMSVLHRCDVPTCVNPAHLFLGTHLQNMLDMTAKQRQARGERLGAAKLTADQVRAIRADQRVQRIIAADYGVGQTQISKIKAGERWSHL